MISHLLKAAMISSAVLVAAELALAQQAFDLDTSFQASIFVPQGSGQSTNIAGLVSLPDGRVVISGFMQLPEYPDPDWPWLYQNVNLARLLPNGMADTTFQIGWGGGKLTEWNGKFYVESGQGIRRLLFNGGIDNSFNIYSSNYFSVLQGGDYHIFSDGRALLAGQHHLEDSLRGFIGLHSLVWLSNEGELDTTRTHRKANGRIGVIHELSTGDFICGGGISQYEGHSVGRIIRVAADGTLDTTFNTSQWFGTPLSFLELDDGKIMAGGMMLFTESPDTLSLVRLLPDGSLDPTFNIPDLDFTLDPTDDWAPVTRIVQLDAGRLLITGGFDRYNDSIRGGIAVIDTSGNLLDDHFHGEGCGDFVFSGSSRASLSGITQAPDGSWYIYGAYHGYDDGTTNDPQQRMVSRLYGLDVGVQEVAVAGRWQLAVWPNPVAQGGVATVELDLPDGVDVGPVELVVQDVMGRTVRMERMERVGTSVQAIFSPFSPPSPLAPGTYLLHLTSNGTWLAGGKLLVE